VLRDAAPDPVSTEALDDCWDEPVQRARALQSLIADGLVAALPDGRHALP
jgi:A/G-specific adenine glycosylase